MTGKKIMVALAWGVACALVTAGALYVKATVIQGGSLAFDAKTAFEVAVGFAAGVIGGFAWQNKRR